MTGILEQILAELQAIKAALGQMPGENVAVQAKPNGAGTVQQQQATQATVDPFAGPSPTPAATITDAQLMALVEPHLDNVAIKTALQGVLHTNGIQKLIEARPDQYASLYQQFTDVIAKASQSGPGII